MGVVPECCGVLGKGVDVGDRLPRRKPVHWATVILGADPSSVHVHHGAHLRHIGTAAVQRIVDGKEVFCRQIVDPLDVHRFMSANINERRNRTLTIAPQISRMRICIVRPLGECVTGARLGIGKGSTNGASASE